MRSTSILGERSRWRGSDLSLLKLLCAKEECDGIESAFQRLQPIAMLEGLRDVAVFCWRARPFVIGFGRHLFLRPQIGPDHAAAFDRRIGE